MTENWRPETIAVTQGRPPREPDAPVNVPISVSSTYVASTSPDALGYGRYGNPTWAALEETAGALERGAALSFASGMAAAAAILDLVPAGGRVLLGENCYLGVDALANELAARGRFTLVRVAVDDTAKLVAAAADADQVWLENPTNPLLDIADIPAVGAALRQLPARLVVDSTFATPILQQPLEMGADLVLHSATKFLSGHSDALAGLVIGRDPQLLEKLRAYRSLHGAILGSFEAFLVLRGLRTLELRVRRSQATAQLLATRLADHPAVRRVRYPGWGGLLSIELVDVATAERLVSQTSIWVNATSLGGVESMFERRRRWPGESQQVPPELVRMSVGIEHPEDLWTDLRDALNR